MAAAVVYPRLYPALDNPSVHFVPVRPQEEEEEEEVREEVREEEEHQQQQEEKELNEEEEAQQEGEEEEETLDGGGDQPVGEEEVPVAGNEEEEAQQEGEEEEETLDGGGDQPVGEEEVPVAGNEEEEEEGQQVEGEKVEKEEASDRRDDDQGGHDPVTTESSDTREPTSDSSSLQQTTNGEITMDNCVDECEKQTTQAKPQTDESNLTLREEYVDRVWEEFVTHFLLGSRHIQKAAIYDLATQRPLAMNGNLRISTEEMGQLIASLHHLQLAYRNGVTLEGRTYKVRLADGRNGILARTEREGCTVCKTHSLILVGVHDETGDSRKCNEDVMRLGDFFRKKAL